MPHLTKVQRLTNLVAGRMSKWLVLVIWVGVTAALMPLASKITDVQSNEAINWLPQSAEATKEFELARDAFPGSDQLVAVVIYARADGITTQDRTIATADRQFFTTLAQAGKISPLIPSEKNQALLLSFPLAGDDQVQSDAVNTIKDRLDANRPAGLRSALTGSAGAVGDTVDAFAGLDSTLLYVTAIVVAILLLITYRSPTLWLVPLISVGVASQIAAALVYLLAKYAGLTVNGQSQGIMTVLVFGAGTDYALLLIARYREELRRHADRHEAMGVALRRSYPAIAASAATVAVSLLCLLAAELNSTRGLGPVGAVGIAVALILMTTLLPALLVICGRWLFWPFVPRYAADAEEHDIAEEHGLWARVAGFVGRFTRPVWIVTVIALIAVSFGTLGLTLGLPSSDQFTKEVGSVTGQRLVDQYYPSGSSAPTDIIAAADHADQVVAAVRGVPGVASVATPVRSGDQQWVRVQPVLTDPPTSKAAEDTVTRLRTAVHAVPGANALVGGQTAIELDTSTAAEHDDKVVIPLILAVVFIVLILLLRALIAPIMLIISVVISFGAAFGAGALIFRALGYDRIDYGLPLLGFLFLVALGVDYTIFLMTRAREETIRVGHRAGMLRALTVTGGVITSAGLVLAATFATLAVLPLIPVLQLGVVVAVGVLLDTLVVRTLLVPACSLDLGNRVWWPSRL